MNIEDAYVFPKSFVERADLVSSRERKHSQHTMTALSQDSHTIVMSFGSSDDVWNMLCVSKPMKKKTLQHLHQIQTHPPLRNMKDWLVLSHTHNLRHINLHGHVLVIYNDDLNKTGRTTEQCAQILGILRKIVENNFNTVESVHMDWEIWYQLPLMNAKFYDITEYLEKTLIPCLAECKQLTEVIFNENDVDGDSVPFPTILELHKRLHQLSTLQLPVECTVSQVKEILMHTSSELHTLINRQQKLFDDVFNESNFILYPQLRNVRCIVTTIATRKELYNLTRLLPSYCPEIENLTLSLSHNDGTYDTVTDDIVYGDKESTPIMVQWNMTQLCEFNINDGRFDFGLMRSLKADRLKILRMDHRIVNTSDLIYLIQTFSQLTEIHGIHITDEHRSVNVLYKDFQANKEGICSNLQLLVSIPGRTCLNINTIFAYNVVKTALLTMFPRATTIIIVEDGGSYPPNQHYAQHHQTLNTFPQDCYNNTASFASYDDVWNMLRVSKTMKNKTLQYLHQIQTHHPLHTMKDWLLLTHAYNLHHIRFNGSVMVLDCHTNPIVRSIHVGTHVIGTLREIVKNNTTTVRSIHVDWEIWDQFPMTTANKAYTDNTFIESLIDCKQLREVIFNDNDDDGESVHFSVILHLHKRIPQLSTLQIPDCTNSQVKRLLSATSSTLETLINVPQTSSDYVFNVENFTKYPQLQNLHTIVTSITTKQQLHNLINLLPIYCSKLENLTLAIDAVAVDNHDNNDDNDDNNGDDNNNNDIGVINDDARVWFMRTDGPTPIPDFPLTIPVVQWHMPKLRTLEINDGDGSFDYTLLRTLKADRLQTLRMEHSIINSSNLGYLIQTFTQLTDIRLVCISDKHTSFGELYKDIQTSKYGICCNLHFMVSIPGRCRSINIQSIYGNERSVFEHVLLALLPIDTTLICTCESVVASNQTITVT